MNLSVREHGPALGMLIFEKKISVSSEFNIKRDILSRRDYSYRYISSLLNDKNFPQERLSEDQAIHFRMYFEKRNTLGLWLIKRTRHFVDKEAHCQHLLLRAMHKMLTEEEMMQKIPGPIFIPYLSEKQILELNAETPVLSLLKAKDGSGFFSIFQETLIKRFQGGVYFPVVSKLSV